MKPTLASESLVIWAVDPLASECKLQRQAAWAIKALANKRALQVQPVYAAMNPLPNLPAHFVSEIYQQLKEKAQEELGRLVRGIKITKLLPLAVLEVPDRSVASQTTAVLAYATDLNAEMIVASTRARKGPARLFLGSFAESLSLKSPLPLLLVNPAWKRKPAFKNILFPTDFSETSHRAFEKVIELAQKTGSCVHIFHKHGFEIAPNWGYAFSATSIYADREEEELRAAQANAKLWEKEAQERGVRASSEVDDQSSGSVSEAILKRSKRAPFLIALAGESAPIEVALLGSIARKVIREASAPVWIVHPVVRSFFDITELKREAASKPEKKLEAAV